MKSSLSRSFSIPRFQCLGPSSETAHLAAYSFPPAVGSGTRIVGRLCRHKLLDWHRRHHEAHAHRYSLSIVLGMILGLAVSSNKFLEETLGGLLVSLQSLQASAGSRWPFSGLD